MSKRMASKMAALATNDVGSLQLLLVAFIEDENWIRLRRALSISYFLDAARSLHDNPALFGANILHVALRRCPPMDIIKAILRKLPETPFLPDSIGRYPLHIASSVGISSDIVDTILGANPQACTKQDLDGRTPLHFACDASRVLYEEDMSKDDGSLNIGIIKCLVSHEPHALHIEDIDEKNAIELALLSDASEEIIFLLQKASVLEHREKRGRSRRGAVLPDDILRSSSTGEDSSTDAAGAEPLLQCVKCWGNTKRKDD